MRKARLSPVERLCGFAAGWLVIGATTAFASGLDTIGVTLLRATTTNLDGSGVNIGHVEAPGNSVDWEVNPGDSRVNLPVGQFTWYTAPVGQTNYPNGLGTESFHADTVGGIFYGLTNGASTNVAHIQNIEANYYYFTAVPSSTAFNAKVVNQSFADGRPGTNYQIASDTNYDNYAAQYNTLFVSAAGDGPVVGTPTVLPPSTSYNGLSVGAYYGATSSGPTADNGRAKPDLCAPGDTTSYSTPLVAGAATILAQAGWRGDGGPDTNAATDIRTLKALLINGAVKPAIWSNPAPSPLDPLFGAGVVNVFNSYHQLIGGKQPFLFATSVPTNAAHPPPQDVVFSYLPVLSGWAYDTITSTTNYDKIHNYCLNLTNTAGNTPYTCAMTLTWNRQFGQAGINNLDLFLYDITTSNLVAASTSVVDNVEHIFIPQLPPGRYNLQVLKHGGGFVSASETYALAYEFFSVPLAIAPAAGNVNITWPLYPSSFILEFNTAFPASSGWSYYYVAPVFTNNQNRVTVIAPGGNVFFRLTRAP